MSEPEQDSASLTESFHRLGRILPANQKLVSITPSATVNEALAMMHDHGFSQLPVVLNGNVFGVFSYRSFA